MPGVGIHDGEDRVSRLGQLLAVSERVLAETTVEGLLQRIVDAACELTGARFGVAEAIRLGHLGMLSMHERAKMVGDTLTIESPPGGATAVYVDIPLPNPPAA
jgi:hypothetical protein